MTRKKINFLLIFSILLLMSLSPLSGGDSSVEKRIFYKFTNLENSYSDGRNLTQLELIDLLRLAIAIEDYREYDQIDNLPYGYDLIEIGKFLSPFEIGLVKKLDNSIKIIYDTAKSGKNIFLLDLDIAPWNQLFHAIKSADNIELLKEVNKEFSGTNKNSLNYKITDSGTGYCNWWETLWCRNGGGIYNHHPIPTWRNIVWKASHASAVSYANSIGFYETPGYASWYSSDDYTKEAMWAPYGAYPTESMRIHGRIIYNSVLRLWGFYAQDIPAAGIPAAEGVEPNPKILEWWINFLPTWWGLYVLDWHLNH